MFLLTVVKSSCSSDLRKAIARVLTIINAKQRAQLRLFYKNKKYLPLDLRPKKTRAIRRRLSDKDASRQLDKTRKRKQHFPQRKYAVKVRLRPSVPMQISPAFCGGGAVRVPEES